jgi:hypothetical protein
MPRLALAFFTAAVLCGLTGMVAGAWMGSTENFTLAPAHAHLNLLGWVTMALYGTFYALTHASMKPKLAWANFTLAAIGVAVMIPSLALYLPAHNAKFIPGIVVGEIATLLSLLIFGISVFRELTRPRLG